mmetsp:Transcript_46699/g.130275  ORF Transcript_46699/g.130275 Transcript_46699/m.130275 type:complete len:405 (-) Transcript_46699:85-1299(-)
MAASVGGGGGSSTITATKNLSFPWQTRDPFLFCVYHDDNFPPGTDNLGPDPKLLRGRNLGQDFGNPTGWSMYHGETVPGFPKHPHRGFETITVTRHGLIDHSDSLGCSGRFGFGDAQWMTAGRGISHCEMIPLLDQKANNRLELFQIWINLPSKNKMDEPYFKMLWNEKIPKITEVDSQGLTTTVGVVAGVVSDVQVESPPSPPPSSWASDADHHVGVFTLRLDAGATYTLPAAAHAGINRNVYFFKGASMTIAGRNFSRHICLEVKAEDSIEMVAGSSEVELLVLQGVPIDQPVVQHGPFVMNTRNEIMQAFQDYQATQFGSWPHADDDPVHPRERGRFAQYADGHEDLPEEVPVDIGSMSVKELKAFITAKGLTHGDCVEKSDLQARAAEAQGDAQCAAEDG